MQTRKCILCYDDLPEHFSFFRSSFYEETGYMRFRKINSRALLAVGYDSARLLLGVRFRISKRVYGFLEVPKNVYESFMNARSKGQYFNQYIKDKYQFVEIKE